MIAVALCIGQQHDPYLVLLALLVCIIGSMATMQLFARVGVATKRSKPGWIILSSVGMGAMVWCTHFVAMLAYRTSAPVVLDPWLTLVSLFLEIALTAFGLVIVAGRRRSRWRAPVGGAVVGAAIAAMHYVGMLAYRVDGLVIWSAAYVVASVALSVALSALAFARLRPAGRPGSKLQAAALLSLAVAALHFTGMTALTIVPLRISEHGMSDMTMTVMAISTALAGMLVIGCGSVSALIDGDTHAETYRRLRRMALHDNLTGLPNRMSFNETLRARLAGLEGPGQSLAVVMLDLARFKTVNDTYGHQAGDQVLIALSARFSALLGPGECIARIGGDEFAALKTIDTPEEVDGFLTRIRASLDEPMVFERFAAKSGASIGVAIAPADGTDPDLLLANADLAMYRAKAVHSPTPFFYEPAMDEVARRRRELGRDLRAGIGTAGFELHYQVQASLRTGAVTGYEALLRWEHPVEGRIPPVVFIPLAEDIGEIVRLGDWVLRQACREAASWPEPHVVAVNLSPLQLSDPKLIDNVRLALEESGLPPGRLELELTESAIIEDRQHALRQLTKIREMGVAIALDDFGAGYSSLDVLRSFPFDRIKLDRSFVVELEQSDEAVAILRSMAALGKTLHIPVLAEGIETANQFLIVARAGCVDAQGYLLGRPARMLTGVPDLLQSLQPTKLGDDALGMVA